MLGGIPVLVVDLERAVASREVAGRMPGQADPGEGAAEQGAGGVGGFFAMSMDAQFGVDPLQYGIVLIIAMGLGAFSPPIGVGMFVTCSICDTTMENASRHMVPYLIVVVIGLLLVAFIPWFSLIVPKMLHMI